METISLVTFVKNEENCIYNMITSVRNYVHELILVDTGSTDKTILQAQYACADRSHVGLTIKIHEMEFTNFGDIRTRAAHLADCKWILMLDADEELSNPKMLNHLVEQDSKAFALPRRRWLDYQMTKQTELEAYPDWQVRLYKNNKDYVWKRELHEYFHGTAVHNFSAGPIIEHFHDVYKTPEKLAERKTQYEKLAALAGVTVEGGHVL